MDFLQKSIEKIGEFNRFGSKPGLERVSELLMRLDNPQKSLKVIHVGGTNGKGSVSRYVYSVLQAAGYKTGLFISPYIERFTERIEFNGSEISPEDLWRLTDRVVSIANEMVAEGLESPTEFEILTAIAFSYYNEKNVDYAVLEVGLGGRGDSTNVVEKPLVSCITSISLDHMDYLGDTLERIAWEKAGIIKRECPVVFAVQDDEPRNVIINEAKKMSAEAIDCSSSYFEIDSEQLDRTVFSAEAGGRMFDKLTISMLGVHQIRNAICALEIFRVLNEKYGADISEESIRKGLAEAKQPGRIEIMRKNPLVILDGSHNYDSVRALAEWADSNFNYDDRILIVTGVLKDKEYDKIAELLGKIGTDFIVTEPDNPRRLDADIYAETIKKHTLNSKITVERDAEDAAKSAIEILYKNFGNNSYKALIFSGSLYMIGIVRKYLSKS